jgi:hypothetical protein
LHIPFILQALEHAWEGIRANWLWLDGFGHLELNQVCLQVEWFSSQRTLPRGRQLLHYQLLLEYMTSSGGYWLDERLAG